VLIVDIVDIRIIGCGLVSADFEQASATGIRQGGCGPSSSIKVGKFLT
jgi:hypothetical protein